MDDHQARPGRRELKRFPGQALSLWVVLWVVCAGCGPAVSANAEARPLSGLNITCEPGDALIYVDDRYLGSVKGLTRKPLVLPVGDHRIEIRREGFFAHFAEVKVVKGVRQQLTIKLRREPFN